MCLHSMSMIANYPQTQTYAPDACKIVLSWELLPSIVEALNPARDNPSGTPPLVQDGVQRELLRASSLGGIVLISSLVLGSMIVAVHALAYLGRDSTSPRTQAGGIALATM